MTAVKLDIANPDTTSVGSQTINYDANGNRTTFAAYGTTDTYVTNNLNQYSSLNSAPITYDATGNLASYNGATASYDAQNRLLSVAGTFETFKYDGLNRQVSRTVGGVTTYNIWDGWNLLVRYDASNNWIEAYDIGAGGLIEDDMNGYYYHDASGSTSHLADSTGHLLEWYRYDLQGTPVFYTSWNTQLSTSNYSVRHLFTGQQWYSELGLYDLRNRFYSPDIGRFLQPDPIGFRGDRGNLHRYCGNNPVTRSDPTGLLVLINYQPVIVNGDFSDLNNYYNDSLALGELGTYGQFGGGGSGEPVGSDRPHVRASFEYHLPPRENIPIPPPPPPPMPNVPLPQPYNPNPPSAADIDTGGDVFAGIEFGLDVAGTVSDAGENLLSGGGGYWLSNRGYYSPDFHGNQTVRGYRLATRGSKALGIAGRYAFYAQFFVSGYQIYQNPTAYNITHQSVNLIMARVGFMWLPGFVIATGYLIINDSIWEEPPFDTYEGPGPY